MKIACGSLEFAWARLRARHGLRPDDAAWHGIEHARAFAPALERARATALRPWLVGITGQSTPAQLEATLRGHWRAYVAELERWLPEPWQAAVAWCALWPELPALQHVARGGMVPAWLDDASGRDALLRQARAGTEPQDADALGAAWVAQWRERLPAHALARHGLLAQLLLTLQAHGAMFAAAPASQAWPQRAELRLRLVRLYRMATLDAAAIFIHLALSALDVERLRAELLRRAWFPSLHLA